MPNRHRGRISAEERERLGETGYKRALAYQRLGINPGDVQCAPFVRADLRRIARLLNQGRANDEPLVRPLELLQTSDDPDARKVLQAYLSVEESYRRLLPFEAFCQAGGASPGHVLGQIAAAAVRQRAEVSAIVGAVWHPRVVAKTVERALQDNGTRERQMLHRACGFV
jgi:hypothetical protein